MQYLRRFKAFLNKASQIRRDREVLMKLDDRMLKDIGISRCEIDRILSQRQD